jgi:PPOX class probable F420-dependent enzyme
LDAVQTGVSHGRRKRHQISDAVQVKPEEARVARLATLDAKCGPHIEPFCFAYDAEVLYTAIDRKPKRVVPERLARLRNVRASPRVALVIGKYDEDWTQLWCILSRGRAKLVAKSAQEERAIAIRLLRAKYLRYGEGMLSDLAPIIRITPERVTPWGKI